MINGVSWKKFFSDLWKEINEDNIFNGAAALGFYLTLAIFPAMIVLLTAIPYLPIEKVDVAIWDLLGQIMPDDAVKMFSGVINEITSNRKAGLLSIGLLGTLWAASSGVYGIMQQLNITYDIPETRSYIKARSTAFGLMLLLGFLVLVGFGLVVTGGKIEEWLVGRIGGSSTLVTTFVVVRWLIITCSILLAFAITYYFGPNVKQKFKFITPGSIVGTLLLIAASLGFRAYAVNFGNFDATYGSIGAVIVLMLWLYINGLVLLFGSELNALIEHYSPEGERKGEKQLKVA